MFNENKINVNGQEVSYWRVDNDVNGNPRYVIHFLEICNDFNEAITISRRVGGKVYRAKWFGGGIVISSYNLESDLKQIINIEM